MFGVFYTVKIVTCLKEKHILKALLAAY